MQRVARVEDDDRLTGVWLRAGTGAVFYAPVALAGGVFALCRVELTDTEDRRRVTQWEVYGRGGAVLGGALEPAAIVPWQALAAVERELDEAGIRLTSGVRQWRLPTE